MRRRNFPQLTWIFYYGSFKALHGISLDVQEKKITALIGPSGCGKSTFLRTLNRMHETVRGTRLQGEILLDGQNILKEDVNAVRLKVGMVFQRSNRFRNRYSTISLTGCASTAFGRKGKSVEIVERSLRKAACGRG